ncbi:MAG: hypothetical protein RL122_1653 [Pseudomonadota bacterium]|jgi:hypothetical protein|uniref:Uncharacterized protein n=1 Tax=Thiothrix fructosivorans TaxID=111770 RepID=A0A8B0SPK1_9GAMM|nr:hypothetical protein [Thiothrix fructosivorans]MBO0612579.1 hypothetical protein [Thiothrix fructosivorans]QTX11948.1 hypothetical protein J1836_006325 [Thiothrix fructosivorans]
MTKQRKERGQMLFDDDQLVQMSEEIAALLVKHLPDGKMVALSGEAARMKSETCVQIFGSNSEGEAVFSINVVFRRPPPRHLNVKCFTPRDG